MGQPSHHIEEWRPYQVLVRPNFDAASGIERFSGRLLERNRPRAFPVEIHDHVRNAEACDHFMKTPVTVIVLTFNESVNIAECLNSVAWADDIIVVDSGSTDDTIALAQYVRPDVRVFTHPFLDFGDQRNWSLDNTQPKHDWILFVDADEFCTPELAEEMGRFIQNPGNAVGAYIKARNYFLGRWLKHSALYPSYQLRLLKRGEVRYRKEGHGQREVTDGKLIYLKEWWRHEPLSKGLHQWVARHNEYTSAEQDLIEALASELVRMGDLMKGPVARRRCLKRIAARYPWLRLFVFVYLYVVRLGFLDGLPGFLFCLLRLSNEIHVVAKRYERRRGQSTSHQGLST